ncbi:MAG: hypothetical protein ABIW16_05520 [Sphingomicrobium sp.]
MPSEDKETRLDEAFERIEETILPCIALMLDGLLDATAKGKASDPKVLAAELQTLAAQLEELMRSVEQSSPAHLDAGQYRVAAS